MDMNRDKGLKILQIPENTMITEDIIKRHYRMMALKYHPDKNKSEDASLKFQEIHAAYEYLNNGKGEPEYKTYDSLLKIFINQIFDDDFQKQIIYLLISRILNKASSRMMDISLHFLTRIDISLLKKIHGFLLFYVDIFGSLVFLEKMNEIIQEKDMTQSVKKDIEYIILHPSLDDLFENNLFKLVEKDQTILVPLWHHELVYDISGIELYVECYPVLPENITIDDENNIHVYLKYLLKDIWSLKNLEIKVGNRLFKIERSQLQLIDFQKYVIKCDGVTKINEDNIYNILEKGDLIFYIEIIE